MAKTKTLSKKSVSSPEKLVNEAFSGEMDPASATVKKAILATVDRLDRGEIRVSEKQNGVWLTHQWIKKAILLYFRIQKLVPMKSGDLSFYDKIPLKKWTGREGVRVVPPAVARKGSYLAPGVITMPSYVNIGAYVDEGSMVDTWATVGSCAQIGKHVHLSGGVGIGGVLEPDQANPVIIEDHAF
jgi:2,3,4,5-tetrahydropyridine-2-carboxylate N-succinyltransferase